MLGRNGRMMLRKGAPMLHRTATLQISAQNVVSPTSLVFTSRRNFSGGPEATPAPTETIQTAVDVAAEPLAELGSTVWHYPMMFIEQIHQFAGVDYFGAIVLGTVALRTILFPIAVKSAINTARLGSMRPHMDKLTQRMKIDPRLQEGTDSSTQVKVQGMYQAEAKALMVKYKVNPMAAMALPLSQMPIMIMFFFSLQQMGDYYPGLAEGGILWFEDLTIKDSTYGLPVINTVFFMLMAELGSGEMKADQQKTMKWAMRAVGMALLPLMSHLPSSLFVYFIGQSVLGSAQALAFKSDGVRKVLGMPSLESMKAMQAAQAASQAVGNKAPAMNIAAKFADIVKKEKAQTEHAAAEIIDGTAPPPPPPGSGEPAPATYKHKPNVKGKKKK